MTRATTGAEVSGGFYTSSEFAAKSAKMTDAAYITNLYNTYLGRAPDAAGLAGWEALLKSGATRLSLLNGFINSEEFIGICQRYRIAHGSFKPANYRDQYYNVTAFVGRLYKLFLNRNPEPAGLEGWCKTLILNEQSGDQLAWNFVYSKEFQGRPLTDEQYITIMYNGLLGRAPDAAGLAGWVANVKRNGRGVVFDGFIASAEWKSIMEQYKLQ